jgi:ankyrin repeat protein
VAQLLLEKGVDINVKDVDRGTALHWVAQEEHETVVRLLQTFVLAPYWRYLRSLYIRFQCSRNPMSLVRYGQFAHLSPSDDKL